MHILDDNTTVLDIIIYVTWQGQSLQGSEHFRKQMVRAKHAQQDMLTEAYRENTQSKDQSPK